MTTIQIINKIQFHNFTKHLESIPVFPFQNLFYYICQDVHILSTGLKTSAHHMRQWLWALTFPHTNSK